MFLLTSNFSHTNQLLLPYAPYLLTLTLFVQIEVMNHEF
jgi:hypothetical protein